MKKSEEKQELQKLRDEVVALREYIRRAWTYFNAIKAEAGCPHNLIGNRIYTPQEWGKITDMFAEVLGDERQPFMSAACDALVKPYRENLILAKRESFDAHFRRSEEFRKGWKKAVSDVTLALAEKGLLELGDI